jgi:hypothetical protein
LKEFVSKEIGNKDTQIKLLTEKYDFIDTHNQELKCLLDSARKERELKNEEAKLNLEAVNSLCQNLAREDSPLDTKQVNPGSNLSLKLDRVLTFQSTESNLGLCYNTDPQKDIKRLMTEEICTKLNRLSESLTNQINDQLQDYETIDRKTQERLSKGSEARDSLLKNNLKRKTHLSDAPQIAFEKAVTQGGGLTHRTEGSQYDHYGIPRPPSPTPKSNGDLLTPNPKTDTPEHARKRSTTQDLLNNIMSPLQPDHDIPNPSQSPDIEKVLGQLPHIDSILQKDQDPNQSSDSGSALNHDEHNLLSQDTNDFLKNMNLGYGYDASSEGEIFEAA